MYGRPGFVPLPSPDIPYTLKYAWGHHFHRDTDNIWVDLQWNILQIEWDVYQERNFDFEIDRIWRDATSMITDEQKILVPNPEDMLFHLCLHLEGHYYAELILFCDIAELLRFYRDRLDWSRFTEMTHRYTTESAVYTILFWCSAYLRPLFRLPSYTTWNPTISKPTFSRLYSAISPACTGPRCHPTSGISARTGNGQI